MVQSTSINLPSIDRWHKGCQLAASHELLAASGAHIRCSPSDRLTAVWQVLSHMSLAAAPAFCLLLRVFERGPPGAGEFTHAPAPHPVLIHVLLGGSPYFNSHQ